VNKILQGDCLDVMKDIDNDTFDIVVSSPPYNIGMNYNTYDDNQVDYVDWQVKVWNEVCRVLKPTGHLFLNVAPGKNNPFEIYDVVKQIDWKLQNSIIWAKAVEIDGYVRGYSTPTSSKRYLMNGWEHLFHFTQDGNTEIDLEQSGVPYGPGPTNPRYKADASNVKRNAKRSGRDWRPTTTCWHLTYKSKATKEITKEIAGEKKHPAIFPEELVEKCIKVSGLKEGTMFDCFAGTGTSLLVAKKMGLDYFGCDLDKDYVEFMKSRMSKEEVWDKFGG